MINKPEDLKNVICPQCGEGFKLIWESDFTSKDTLIISSCPSGGIYDVCIQCPHCNYNEPL